MLSSITRAICVSRHIIPRQSCTKSGDKTGDKNENKSAIKGELMQPLGPSKVGSEPDKITVVGAGQVGMACCVFLLANRLTSELCIMDVRKEWIAAEALDFLHASPYIGNPKIVTTSDGKQAKDSKYIVVTAGARPGKDTSRLALVNDTAKIMKAIIPNLVKYSPNATYIIISNPADVMTYVAQKIGKLPRERCFTTGCHLDSSRFQYFIASRLDVSPSSVVGYIIGEHGNSSVPVWSSVNVGGVPLISLIPEIGTEEDDDNWAAVHKNVVQGAYKVVAVKGYTNWAIGATVADVISKMKENSGIIASVGTNVKGYYGIDQDVVLSLPCVLSRDGISQILQLPLTDWENEKLAASIEALLAAQKTLKDDDGKGGKGAGKEKSGGDKKGKTDTKETQCGGGESKSKK